MSESPLVARTLPRGPASGKSRRHSLKDSRPWKASNPGLTWVTGKKTPAIPGVRFQSERTRHGKEHDLRLVRQGRRGCRPLLRRDLSRQRGGRRPPCAQRLPLRQEGRRADGRIHGCRRPLPRPQRRSRCSSTAKPSRSRSPPTIRQETDRYWNAIVGNGGQESACGWCKDKWGISWQITPRVLTEAMAAGGDEAKRAFEAMMDMKKIDVAAIEAARRG